MQCKYLILGIFLVALIVTAGCTSTQKSTQRGDSTINTIQTTGKTNDAGSVTLLNTIINCPSNPQDPIKYKDFFPEVPGFTKYSLAYENYTTKHNDYFENHIGQYYKSSDPNKFRLDALVFIHDFGPCAGNFGLNRPIRLPNPVRSHITFHGFPTTTTKLNSSWLYDYYDIGISNRLIVSIYVAAPPEDTSMSDADAMIEQFANAIDFNRLAAA